MAVELDGTKINDTSLTFSIAKEIWEALKHTYSKACDAAQVYEIRIRATLAKQGCKTVTDYANELKTLW